jgi:putative sigma-54 modulation protein
MSAIIINSHHVEVTEPIKAYVLKKFERIERHFEKITKINVTLKVDKNTQVAEATILAPGHSEFFAQSSDANLYAAIDALTDKLDRQVIKHKEKQQGQ